MRQRLGAAQQGDSADENLVHASYTKLGDAGWAPPPPVAGKWKVVGRLLSVMCYPVIIPFNFISHCDATVDNARWWRGAFALQGLLAAVVCHTLVWWKVTGELWSLLFAHSFVFLAVDHAFIWLVVVANTLVKVFEVNRSGNRLKAGHLKGPRVVVIGNGPSAVEGKCLGHLINDFDEVVRFNNFQTKTANLEKWVGHKTTVHFSDGVLYPTYPEYHAPGATVMLSLIMERFIVAGSYVILRMAADLEYSLTTRFLMDPALHWIEKADIERLKGTLGIAAGGRHPTSGLLAVDHFIHQKGVQLPVYIHGFDFFIGTKMHYYEEHEPFYERLNDRIGVNMHNPQKEKQLVDRLVAEGKVKWLKDLATNT